MNDTVLVDKLLRLRLPAFREGLREQQANPKFAELSFEERLALLVDQECIRRHNNRIRPSLHSAAFPMQATLEDLEFSPQRGLDRRQILELGQCTWIGNHLNVLVLGPTGAGKVSFLALWAQPQSGWAFRCAISALPACCMPSLRPARMHLTPPCCAPWPGLTCSSWTTGCGTNSLLPMPRIFWKSWMTATARLPPSLLPKCLWITGSPKSPTPLWLTLSWIAWFTMPTGSNSPASLKESYGQFGPCRTLDVQLPYQRIFPLPVRHAPFYCAISPEFALPPSHPIRPGDAIPDTKIQKVINAVVV